MFSTAGTITLRDSRIVDVRPQSGRNIVFELGPRFARSYEVQILVDGAEDNVFVSAWKITFSEAGTIFHADKRVLHSEMVSRFVPFVPVIPLPPVVGAVAPDSEEEAPEVPGPVPEGPGLAPDDGSSGSDDDMSSRATSGP